MPSRSSLPSPCSRSRAQAPPEPRPPRTADPDPRRLARAPSRALLSTTADRTQRLQRGGDGRYRSGRLGLHPLHRRPFPEPEAPLHLVRQPGPRGVHPGPPDRGRPARTALPAGGRSLPQQSDPEGLLAEAPVPRLPTGRSPTGQAVGTVSRTRPAGEGSGRRCGGEDPTEAAHDALVRAEALSALRAPARLHERTWRTTGDRVQPPLPDR